MRVCPISSASVDCNTSSTRPSEGTNADSFSSTFVAASVGEALGNGGVVVGEGVVGLFVSCTTTSSVGDGVASNWTTVGSLDGTEEGACDSFSSFMEGRAEGVIEGATVISVGVMDEVSVGPAEGISVVGIPLGVIVGASVVVAALVGLADGKEVVVMVIAVLLLLVGAADAGK